MVQWAGKNGIICITAFLNKQTQLQIVFFLVEGGLVQRCVLLSLWFVSLPLGYNNCQDSGLKPLLVLGHPCGCCSQWLYPEGQLGAPQVLFFPLGTISHTVLPSP